MTLLRKCLLELRARDQEYQMNELNGHDIEDLRPGMHATVSKTITEADIDPMRIGVGQGIAVILERV